MSEKAFLDVFAKGAKVAGDEARGQLRIAPDTSHIVVPVPAVSVDPVPDPTLVLVNPDTPPAVEPTPPTLDASLKAVTEELLKLKEDLEAEERERQITEALLKLKEEWISRIQAVRTKDGFKIIDNEAGKNAKHTGVPGFVVGKPLLSLYETYPPASNVEKKKLRGIAFGIQKEIEEEYLRKEQELYSSATQQPEPDIPLKAAMSAKQDAQVAPVRRRMGAKKATPKPADAGVNQVPDTAAEDQEKIETARTAQVASTMTFEQLYTVLAEFKEIPVGNSGKMSFKEIKELIEEEKVGVDISVEDSIKSGTKERIIDVAHVRPPKTYGIRVRVDKLLSELFEKKLQEHEAAVAVEPKANMPQFVAAEKDDYASGKVFADEYLELNPILDQEEALSKRQAEQKAKMDAEISALKQEIEGINKRAQGGEKVSDEVVIKIEEEIRRLEKLKEEKSTTAEPVAVALEPATPELGAPRDPEVMPVTLEAGVPEEGRETLYLKIERLTKEVNEARADWVSEDVKRTTFGKKFKSLLGTRQEEKKYAEQEKYEKLVRELQVAEVEMMRGDMAGEGTALSEKDTQEGMERLLRYYKLDEAVNLINERTQYKAEHQNFSDKIVDSLGAVGRWYNRIPLKYKALVAGALLGSAVLAPLAIPAAGIMGVAVARKVLTGLGTAVGVEAGLEKFGAWNRERKAEKEVTEQMATPEMNLDRLSQMLQGDILSLDAKLQNEKSAKTWRKIGAVGIGVGAGWLAQIVSEKISGSGAFGWIKDQFGNVPAIEAHKGDSTWKLLGEYLSAKDSHFAGMNEAQRTYAIDALKDKLAEMSPDQLKAAGFQSGDISKLGIGERINFDKLVGSDVAHAMKDASGISAEAVKSITDNNATILDWARTNPNVKLTDEVVDKILHGNGSGGGATGTPVKIEVQMQNESSLGQGLKMPAGISESPVDTPVGSGAVAENVQETVSDTGPVFTAELQPRVDDWYGQIFRVENARLGQDWVFDKETIAKVKILDIVKDARLLQQGSFSGYTTGLNSEQVRNFAEFSQSVAKSNTGFDNMAFFRENPNATVMDYLKKVAPLVQQGQRLGLYTATH